MASPAPTTTSRPTVVPSEVGWQFVSQYYTFVNKQPHRLHCFYTKNSTYIHGVEGEDSVACHGQQEIHNKILSIGFQDCKVFIHSVDAQSSASSGIIIQVIGEMSNAGEAWRKFAQTFFLAEQPNGYFVLNDVFRYLKEESSGDDDVEEDVKEETEVNEEEPAPEPAATTTQLHDVPEHPATQPEPEPVVSLPPPAPQEPPAPEPAPEAPAVNGTHAEEKTPEPPKETTQLPSPSPEPEPEPAEEPTPADSTPARGLTPAPAPAPVSSAPAASPAPPATEKPQPPAATPSAAPAPAQPAQPAAPPAPKTWANLAAANSSKWGQVSSDARGVSTSAKPTTPTPKPAPAAPPARKEEAPIDTSNLPPQAQAALAVNTAQCFIKLNDWVRDNGPGNQAQSSAESVSPAALKEALTARFGPIKELEVVRTKACAFLEFVSVESARRAILASLPTNQGGEGGIRIGEDTPTERAPRITVEMRKERGDRPMSGGRPRTGGQEQRGSFRGGRGGGGRGRGESRPAAQAAK